MAQKVQVVLVDDIDGGEASQTVSLSIDNQAYEIDLSDAHAAELRAAIAPWTSKARKASARRSPRSKSEDVAKIRSWARANGFDVSQRGRISSKVRDAYQAAH
jgi:hypothetical protein